MQEIGAPFLYFDFSGHVLDVNFGVNVGETCVIEYSEDRTKREVDPQLASILTCLVNTPAVANKSSPVDVRNKVA